MSSLSSTYIEERADFYALTKMLFMSEPTKSSAEAIYKIFSNDYFPFSAEWADVKKVNNDLSQKLEKIDESDFFSNLNHEFYHLFFDPHFIAASPWQSSYTNSDGLLFQESDFHAKYYYTKWGFKVAYDNYPRDHIAIELDFMHKLSQKLCDGDETVILDMSNFLSEHILAWIGDFIGALDKAGSVYYLLFAKIIEAGSKYDSLQLKELMKERVNCD